MTEKDMIGAFIMLFAAAVCLISALLVLYYGGISFIPIVTSAGLFALAMWATHGWEKRIK